MGRYGAPRAVRYILGAVIGASVFAASSVAMFSLAASAGTSSSLLGSVSNAVGDVTNTVGTTVNTLVGPSGAVCTLLCSVTNSVAQPAGTQPQNPLPCLNQTLCDATNALTGTKPATGTGSGTSSSSTQVAPPAPAAPPGTTGAHPGASRGSVIAPDPPAGVTTGTGSLVQPPPSSITLPTATSGINFGKAPFLWPLFLGLDVLGAAAVVLALRKTWSRPVTD